MADINTDSTAPADASPHGQLLKRGFPQLSFPEPLEAQFRDDQVASTVRWVRLCLLVAICTSLGFSAMDHWVLRTNNAIPDLVRYGLQLPVLLVCLVVTLRPALMRWYPLAIQIGGPLYGAGTVLLVAYAQADHVALVGARLLLVNFFLFFMCGLRLPPALRCNLLILAMLVAAGLAGMIPAEVAIYLSFAYVIGIVIGSAGLYALEHATRTSFLERRLLRELAALDGLTRLLNRPTFDSQVRERWRTAATQRQPVTVLMVDVDNFKLYNDHYGHQAGDDCLRRVAAAVQSALSSTHDSCVVARYGGEEFIALLVSPDAQTAAHTAQQVVEAVAGLAIPHAAAPDRAHVSVSVGAAVIHDPTCSSYEAVARQADEALYAAKRRGRNCSVMLQSAAA